MALPAVELGKAYPIEIGALLGAFESRSAVTSKETFHTMVYAPETHLKKGAAIVSIDTSHSGSINETLGRGGSNSSATLSFTNVEGEINTFSGALLPSRNEFLLLFDGSTFELKPVTSGALNMSEAKRNDKKRVQGEIEADGAPAAKRPKASESGTSSANDNNGHSKDISNGGSTAQPAVSFSLTKPKTASSALIQPSAVQQASATSPIDTQAESKPNTLTKSMEMRALMEEPDSDDSDDSD